MASLFLPLSVSHLWMEHQNTVMCTLSQNPVCVVLNIIVYSITCTCTMCLHLPSIVSLSDWSSSLAAVPLTVLEGS